MSYKGGDGGTPLLESKKRGSRRWSMSDSDHWNDNDDEDSGNFVV